MALVTVAIVLDAAAYRRRENRRSDERLSPGTPASDAPAATTRGIVLSLVAGLLMGTFYPLVARAMAGDPAHPQLPPPGPYAIAFFFAIGVLLINIPANWLLMKKPLDGKPPVSGADYWRAELRLASGRHLRRIRLVRRRGLQLRCLAGSRQHWSCGVLLHRPGRNHGLRAVGRVRLARVRRGIACRAKLLLTLMFLFFLLGLGSVAMAPLY